MYSRELLLGGRGRESPKMLELQWAELWPLNSFEDGGSYWPEVNSGGELLPLPYLEGSRELTPHATPWPLLSSLFRMEQGVGGLFIMFGQTSQIQTP